MHRQVGCVPKLGRESPRAHSLRMLRRCIPVPTHRHNIVREASLGVESSAELQDWSTPLYWGISHFVLRRDVALCIPFVPSSRHIIFLDCETKSLGVEQSHHVALRSPGRCSRAPCGWRIGSGHHSQRSHELQANQYVDSSLGSMFERDGPGRRYGDSRRSRWCIQRSVE